MLCFILFLKLSIYVLVKKNGWKWKKKLKGENKEKKDVKQNV